MSKNKNKHKNKTNKRRNYYTHKRNKKHRSRNSTTKKATKKAGMLRLLRLAITVALFFTSVYNANGHVVYTVCRGNTCRSPYYRKYLQMMFGKDHTFDSFGTHPKVLGAKMAPETRKYAENLCPVGDQECIDDVNDHSSKSIDCVRIKEQIHDGESVYFIPMDSEVEGALHNQMSCFTPEELTHITVIPSANITDPFSSQGTAFERETYARMKEDVERSASEFRGTLGLKKDVPDL